MIDRATNGGGCRHRRLGRTIAIHGARLTFHVLIHSLLQLAKFFFDVGFLTGDFLASFSFGVEIGLINFDLNEN